MTVHAVQDVHRRFLADVADVCARSELAPDVCIGLLVATAVQATRYLYPERSTEDRVKDLFALALESDFLQGKALVQ